jgi:anti-sigma regulatory factor (Ser/Thr protein kinase)
VIGRRVRAAAEAGRPLTIYGEMVALLWDADNVGAAMALEELWNSLARDVVFSLLCAYPRSAGGDDGGLDDGGLGDLCTLHSGVIGARSRSQSRSFRAEPASASAARRFVTEELRRWGQPELIPDAALVATELASNALVHARTDFTLAVCKSGETIRISVRDGSRLTPVVRQPPLTSESGRGLRLIAGTARRWGTQPLDRGKITWAELHS